MDSEDLLSNICCPNCQNNLTAKSETLLFCENCSKEFMIKNNIPILLNERI